MQPPAQQPTSPVPPQYDINRYEQEDEDDFLEKQNKSPLVGIIVTIVVILAVAGGALFGVRYYLQMNEQKQAQLQAQEQARQAAAKAQADSIAAAQAAMNEDQEQTSSSSRTPVVRRSSTPRRTTSSRASTPAPVSNILTIVSEPSGATVSVDGKVMGTTPFTWDSPFFGGMRIAVSKAGYREAERFLEYVGGSRQESFSLQQQESTPEPAPAAVQRSTPVAPARTSSAPVAQAPSQPEPRAPEVESEPTGDPATIFLSSLPPVADVYMNGKLIGKTNVAELKVLSGTHQMRFVKGGKQITKEMTFQPGKNPSQMIRIP
jgi:type II secretory pathway pseudopilin PulG